MIHTFALCQSYRNGQEYLSRWGWSTGGENGEPDCPLTTTFQPNRLVVDGPETGHS